MHMTLAEIVSRQQERAATVADEVPHWQARRDKWLEEINRLFTDITDWLQQAGVGADAIKNTQQTVYEERLGHYSTPVLTVTIGLHRVTFRPKGTFLMGAYGRIDATSDQPDTPIIKLVADVDLTWAATPDTPAHDQDWQWLIYPGGARPGGGRLSQDTFTSLMALLLGESLTVGA